MVLRRTLVAVLTALAAATTSACAGEQATPEDARDELADFAPDSSEALGGQPYDVYVRIAERNGLRFLDFREAEELAASLCSGEVEEDEDRSPHDTALVRAYCPEQEGAG